MAAPTFVTVHAAGKGTGSNEMNQGNASVGGSQIDLGTSGDVTILCLVSSTQSNGDGIDYVTVGSASLTADTALLDWSADFGASRHRAFSATGITLTGSQNWTVGRNTGAGFGFDAVFYVLAGGASSTNAAIAGAVKNATEVYTASISSNSNSLIVALVQKDRKAASCTVSTSGGSTVTDNDATTFGFSRPNWSSYILIPILSV